MFIHRSKDAPRELGRPPVALWILILTVAMSLAAPGIAQDYPRVRFASPLHSVVEGATTTSVRLVLSEPATEVTVVNVTIEAGTATPGVDFVAGSIAAHFNPGALDTSRVTVEILSDFEIEDPETIVLTIQEGVNYEVAYPSVGQVVIVDDDSETLTAHFEAPDGVPLDPLGRILVPIEPETPFAIDVVVYDLPPGGGHVDIMTNTPEGILTLEFVDDPHQTLNLISPSIPPGADYGVLHLAILDNGNKIMAPEHLMILFSMDVPEYQRCFWCLVQWALVGMGVQDCKEIPNCEVSCPEPPPEQLREESGGPKSRTESSFLFYVLRNYRDNVLMNSPAGEYYIDLYETLSVPGMRAVMQRPDLIYKVYEAWELWTPAIQAQASGLGASFTITQEMQDALLAVLDAMEEVGTADLVDEIHAHRTELDLDHVAGLTTDELQMIIEDSSLETEAMNLDQLKAMFR